VCSRCAPGTFQRSYHETACVDCTRGFFCREGAAEPVPCPAGHVGNATGLYSSSQCTPVPVHYWAPLGSSVAELCPSGMYCPGALRDDLFGGAKPIIMPTGGSAETTAHPALVKAMTLDISIEDFELRRQALQDQLAAQYAVHPSLITLQATPGSLQLTITIATTNGANPPIDIVMLRDQVNAVDSAALTTSISQALNMNVNISNYKSLADTTVAVTREITCQRGQWHVDKELEPATAPFILPSRSFL
jgi:hypothetical protein